MPPSSAPRAQRWWAARCPTRSTAWPPSPPAGTWSALVRNHELRDTPGRSVPLRLPATPTTTKGPGGNTTLDGPGLPQREGGAGEAVRQPHRHVHQLRRRRDARGAPGSPPRRPSRARELGFDRTHGYNFEVQVDDDGISRAGAAPATWAGSTTKRSRWTPRSGFVYQTEDRTPSGFYRYKPKTYGKLRRAVSSRSSPSTGKPQYNTMTGQRRFCADEGEVGSASPSPTQSAASCRAASCSTRGWSGARRSSPGWRAAGTATAASSSTRPAAATPGAGQVWQYHIGRRELQLIFESPSTDVLNSPDNICVSPRGGLVICEDGSGVQHVRGLTPTGEIFDLARNDASGTEWAGACFSPQGRTLFVNLQGETRPLQNPAGDKGPDASRSGGRGRRARSSPECTPAPPAVPPARRLPHSHAPRHMRAARCHAGRSPAG